MCDRGSFVSVLSLTVSTVLQLDMNVYSLEQVCITIKPHFCTRKRYCNVIMFKFCWHCILFIIRLNCLGWADVIAQSNRK